MKKYKWIIILLNLIIILAFYNYSIVKKEKTLSTAKLVLLELAPVSPKSLIQDNYMILRYKISNDLLSKDYTKRGYFIVKVKSNNLATRVRVQKNPLPLKKEELLIKYFVKNYQLSIGAERFFFQEGQAKKFEEAKYAALRVDKSGSSVLVGLYDKNLKFID